MKASEFDSIFEELCKTFSVVKKNEKAEVYFKRFKKLDFNIFHKVIIKIIDTYERFPMIAQIKKEYSAIKPVEKIERQDCDICDGFGRVFLGLEIFKSRCCHSEDIFKDIKLVPQDEARELLDQKKNWDNIYGAGYWEKKVDSLKAPLSVKIDKNTTWDILIMLDPDMFFKGFKDTAPLIRKANPKLFDKIIKIIKDSIGKEKAIFFWKKYMKSFKF